MSNYNQFMTKAFPIGASVTMVYNGDLYNAPDGSQWLASTSTSPFDYTSDYANLPDSLKSPHNLLSGPDNGYFTYVGNINIVPGLAYNPSGPLYVTSSYSLANTTSFNYYTSSDGITWTKRIFPNNKSYQNIQYTAGKFIASNTQGTTNALITSTDGINWSSFNIASYQIYDIISDGGSNILVWPASGTTANVSNDGGSTWSGATITAPGGGSTGVPGIGAVTWNPGAGLFIATTSTAGTYQTSPTGVTWTSRNPTSWTDYISYLNASTKFASNATITIAVGAYGFCATSTDGLTWSNYNYIPNVKVTGAPDTVWHDGTRFCVRFKNLVYYSSNGTSWTQGKNIGQISNGSLPVSGNTLFAYITINGGIYKFFKVSDVTSTVANTVCINLAGSYSAYAGTAVNYYRIK